MENEKATDTWYNRITNKFFVENCFFCKNKLLCPEITEEMDLYIKDEIDACRNKK